jgi:hypothetical protein
LNHWYHDLKDTSLLGPAVDEVSKKNHTPGAVLPASINRRIAKVIEKTLQGVCFAVDIADNIEALTHRAASMFQVSRHHLSP